LSGAGPLTRDWETTGVLIIAIPGALWIAEKMRMGQLQLFLQWFIQASLVQGFDGGEQVSLRRLILACAYTAQISTRRSAPSRLVSHKTASISIASFMLVLLKSAPPNFATFSIFSVKPVLAKISLIQFQIVLPWQAQFRKSIHRCVRQFIFQRRRSWFSVMISAPQIRILKVGAEKDRIFKLGPI
jgi:hypothetical protein